MFAIFIARFIEVEDGRRDETRMGEILEQFIAAQGAANRSVHLNGVFALELDLEIVFEVPHVIAGGRFAVHGLTLAGQFIQTTDFLRAQQLWNFDQHRFATPNGQFRTDNYSQMPVPGRRNIMILIMRIEGRPGPRSKTTATFNPNTLASTSDP